MKAIKTHGTWLLLDILEDKNGLNRDKEPKLYVKLRSSIIYILEQSLVDRRKILKKEHGNSDERIIFRLVFVDRSCTCTRTCVTVPIKFQISGNTES